METRRDGWKPATWLQDLTPVELQLCYDEYREDNEAKWDSGDRLRPSIAMVCPVQGAKCVVQSRCGEQHHDVAAP